MDAETKQTVLPARRHTTFQSHVTGVSKSNDWGHAAGAAAKPAAPAPAAGSGQGAQDAPVWRRDAEKAGPLRALEWAGVARAAASWARRWGVLHRGHLYLLESQDAPHALTSANVWLNKCAP